MDEVPIVTANPVNIVLTKTEKPVKASRKDRIKETLLNFFRMSPLGLIILAQFFFLGKSFGNFSTFPLTSVTTFILIGSILLLLGFAQMLMRSIIFSTFAGIALTMGIFSSWFGDFHTPLIENFREVSVILKSAWTRKNIPFNLLITSSLTTILAAVAFLQFFAALLIKSFFEVFFGKEWGDGRLLGFIGAIALLAGVHGSFYYYSSSAGQTSEKIAWSIQTKFKPMEKFLTRTPDNFMIGKSRLFVGLEGEAFSIDLQSGKKLETRIFKPGVVHMGIQNCIRPVFCGNDAFYGFNEDFNLNSWKTDYPAEFPGYEYDEEKNGKLDSRPLTTYLIQNSSKLLAVFDYGYIAVYDAFDGEQKWIQSYDLKIATNRTFPENYLHADHLIDAGNRLVISCHNGIVKCFDSEDGKLIWTYQHDTPKIGGKSQKAFLTSFADKVVLAYKSGEIITLAIEDGRKIYEAINPAFSAASPVFCEETSGTFLTDEGILYNFELDGGKILYTANALPRRLNLVPVVTGLNKGIIAHRDEVIKFDLENKSCETILTSSNRVFVTRPVFDEKIMYIGTQDGWVFCLHTGSMHEKWRTHIKGELKEDSLIIYEDKLIVKTTSGSIFCINRGF